MIKQNQYYEFSRIKVAVCLLVAFIVLTIKCFSHTELHALGSPSTFEQLEQEAQDKDNERSYESYQADPENASDSDRQGAQDYVDAHGV